MPVLHIDSHTLRDLDIMGGSSPSLLGLLDHCCTRGGRERLRQHMLRPPGDGDELQRLQDAVRWVVPRENELHAAIESLELDEVERYLGTGWELSHWKSRPARDFEFVWLRMRHGDFIVDIRRGVRRLVTLTRALRPLAGMLRGSEATLLQEIGDGLQRGIDAAELQPLVTAGESALFGAALLHLDDAARDRGRAAAASLIASVAELDQLVSLARATARHGWSFPEMGDAFEVTGLLHPFLPEGVRNDLSLDAGTRLVVITGANMAGKTTFLKACALVHYLAHLGCGVPAVHMRFSPVTALQTSIQITDSVTSGESFYLAEVRRVRALVDELMPQRPILGILDEPFRGTNVHDAAEATGLLLQRLAAHPAGLVLVATHMHEALAGLANHGSVRFLSFESDMQDGTPHFNFRLREGVSSQRLGMALLRREGVVDRLRSW